MFLFKLIEVLNSLWLHRGRRVETRTSLQFMSAHFLGGLQDIKHYRQPYWFYRCDRTTIIILQSALASSFTGGLKSRLKGFSRIYIDRRSKRVLSGIFTVISTWPVPCYCCVRQHLSVGPVGQSCSFRRVQYNVGVRPVGSLLWCYPDRQTRLIKGCS